MGIGLSGDLAAIGDDRRVKKLIGLGKGVRADDLGHRRVSEAFDHQPVSPDQAENLPQVRTGSEDQSAILEAAGKDLVRSRLGVFPGVGAFLVSPVFFAMDVLDGSHLKTFAGQSRDQQGGQGGLAGVMITDNADCFHTFLTIATQ